MPIGERRVTASSVEGKYSIRITAHGATVGLLRNMPNFTVEHIYLGEVIISYQISLDSAKHLFTEAKRMLK